MEPARSTSLWITATTQDGLWCKPKGAQSYLVLPHECRAFSQSSHNACRLRVPYSSENVDARGRADLVSSLIGHSFMNKWSDPYKIRRISDARLWNEIMVRLITIPEQSELPNNVTIGRRGQYDHDSITVISAARVKSRFTCTCARNKQSCQKHGNNCLAFHVACKWHNTRSKLSFWLSTQQ